jgi:hypothetical protein
MLKKFIAVAMHLKAAFVFVCNGNTEYLTNKNLDLLSDTALI